MEDRVQAKKKSKRDQKKPRYMNIYIYYDSQLAATKLLDLLLKVQPTASEWNNPQLC